MNHRDPNNEQAGHYGPPIFSVCDAYRLSPYRSVITAVITVVPIISVVTLAVFLDKGDTGALIGEGLPGARVGEVREPTVLALVLIGRHIRLEVVGCPVEIEQIRSNGIVRIV